MRKVNPNRPMNPARKTKCLTYGESEQPPAVFVFSTHFKKQNFNIAGTLCGKKSQYIYLAADFDLGPRPKDVCADCWKLYWLDVEFV
jgi:hypothetical protein